MVIDTKTDSQLAYLGRWLTNIGIQPPILLSSSDPDLLKQAIAQLKLQAVCTENGGCGHCTECKLVLAHVHPDCLDVSPRKKTWTIADVRELRERMVRTTRGQRRLVVLRAVETLSIPAANALLKTLEEPSAKTRLLLLTQWPGRLLPTIISRVFTLRLQGSELAGPLEDTGNTIASLLQRAVGKKEKLTEEELTAIAKQLSEELRTVGPTMTLRRAFLRLCDYYRITSARGNERLATDVLLLSLPRRHGMSYSR